MDEKILTAIFALSIGFFYFFYLTENNQVFGIDAWYWLKFGLKKPVYQNLISLAFWLSVFFLFYFLESKEKPYFIASIFLLMPFNIGFLEVELDDYVFTILSFILIIVSKKLGFNPRILAFVIVLFYLSFYSFFLFGDNVHKEIVWNPLNLVFVFPLLVILFQNKKYKDLALILVLSILFCFGKFVRSALPIYTFAVFLDFLNEFHIGKTALSFLLVFSLIIYYVSAINMVEANKIAFEKYCNKETKICNNWEEPHYGHYFAYLGYVSNNSYEFGVCTCVSQECLNRTIKC